MFIVVYCCIAQRSTSICAQSLCEFYLNLYYVFKFKALMYEHLYIFTASILVARHSQALFVVMFNGFNYLDWSEQV